MRIAKYLEALKYIKIHTTKHHWKDSIITSVFPISFVIAFDKYYLEMQFQTGRMTFISGQGNASQTLHFEKRSKYKIRYAFGDIRRTLWIYSEKCLWGCKLIINHKNRFAKSCLWINKLARSFATFDSVVSCYFFSFSQCLHWVHWVSTQKKG